MYQASNPFPAPETEPACCLTFAPLAWLKLQYFCHAGDTEIGGFGISAENDPLYIKEFLTVRQQVTSVTVRFADDAVADFFDRCVLAGLKPQRFARVWCHTHPSSSVTPSNVDEATFRRVFGRCDWALMFILGRTGLTYARLAFNAGPGAALLLPTAVDWCAWPKSLAIGHAPLASELAQWQQEYQQNIQLQPELPLALAFAESGAREWWEDYPYHAELDEVTYGLAEPDFSLADPECFPPF